MATNSSVGNDQGATNVEGLWGELARSIRLKNTEDGQGNTGSASNSPSTPPATVLADKLSSCLHNYNIKRTSSSPPIASPAKRSCQGHVALSPSRSATSDSSMSASATGYISSSSRETESNTVPPVSSLPHYRSPLVYESRFNMDSVGNVHHTSATDVQPRVAELAVGGGGGRGLKMNPPSMVGRGKHGLAPGSSTPGCAASKGTKPRRTRKSKKPHTEIIEADPQDFRDMVQKLTGCRSDAGLHVPSGSQLSPQPPTGPPGSGVSIVRPQPQRPNSMDTDTQNPPAVGGLEASSKSLISSMSSARGPSSVQVTDQAPGVSFPYRDSYSASTSCSSKSTTAMQLNYCMGYEQSIASFMDIASAEDSGLENGSLQLPSASESFFGCGYSTGAPLATPLISNSSIRSLRKDDIAKSPMHEDHEVKMMESLLRDEDPENNASVKTSNALVDSFLAFP